MNKNINIVAHGDPAKFVITNATTPVSVDNNATFEIQLQDNAGNVVTSNNSAKVTVENSAGSLNASQPVTMTNGVAHIGLHSESPGNATVSLQDTEKTGFATDSTAEIVFTPGNATQIDVSGAPEKIASEERGVAKITAQVKDQYGNLKTDDNSTSVTFTVANGTDYANLHKVVPPDYNVNGTINRKDVQVINGVAEIVLSSTTQEISEDKEVDVTVESGSLSVPSSPLTFYVVDFSLDAGKAALETDQTTTLTVIGANGTENIELVNNPSKGSITDDFSYSDSTGQWTATYRAGDSAGTETLQVNATKHLKTTTNELTIDIYDPVEPGAGFDQPSITVDQGSAQTFTVNGGDTSSMVWYVTGPEGGNATSQLSGNNATKTFNANATGDYAGEYVVEVTDETLGESLNSTVIVPLGAVSANATNVLTNGTMQFDVQGASSGLDWEIVDANGDPISSAPGTLDGSTNSTTVFTAKSADDVGYITPFYVRARKDSLDATISTSDRKRVILPVASMHVSANPETVASDGLGSSHITAQARDKFDSNCDYDNGTQITFEISNATYLKFTNSTGGDVDADGNATTETVSTVNGTADIYLTSKSGEVNSTKHTTLNATAEVTVNGAPIILDIVDFSLQVADADNKLEVGESTAVTVYGALGNDTVSIVDDPDHGSLTTFENVGQAQWNATYTAKNAGNDTLRASSAELGETNTVNITVYDKFNPGSGLKQNIEMDPGGNATFTVSGGDDIQWSATDPDGDDVTDQLAGNSTSRTFTAPSSGDYAGKYTIDVWDNTFGNSANATVIVPLGDVTANATNVLDGGKINYTVAGASSGVTWDVVDKNGDSLSGVGSFDGSNDGSTDFTTSYDGQEPQTFYAKAVKGGLQETASESVKCTVLPTQTYTVTVNKAKGGAIPNATVQIIGPSKHSGKSNSTNVDGECTFVLPAGNDYRMQASADGYFDSVLSIDGDKTEKEIYLKQVVATNSYVNGTITKNGNPVAGSVKLYITYNSTKGKTSQALKDPEYRMVDDTFKVFFTEPKDIGPAASYTVVAKTAGYAGKNATGSANLPLTNIAVDMSATNATAGFDPDVGGSETFNTTNGDVKIDLSPGGAELTNGTSVVFTVGEKDNNATGMDASGTKLVEVNATNGTVSRLTVTIPFKLSEVDTGDFKSGKKVIYHADTVDALQNGPRKKVSPSDIIDTDFVGDGNYGSVTFEVDSLSVFGIGGSSGGSIGGSGGGGGCVYNPDASFGPEWLLLLALPLLAGWSRRRKRS